MTRGMHHQCGNVMTSGAMADPGEEGLLVHEAGTRNKSNNRNTIKALKLNLIKRTSFAPVWIAIVLGLKAKTLKKKMY